MELKLNKNITDDANNDKSYTNYQSNVVHKFVIP